MVLVDTSIWIPFLANRAPYAKTLDALLDPEEVVAHELVYGELLIGDITGRRKFLIAYERIQRATTVPHSDVVAIVRQRGLHGRGIGWIDAHLIASAILGRLKLWTADSNLSAVAEEMGVSYRSSVSSSAQPAVPE